MVLRGKDRKYAVPFCEYLDQIGFTPRAPLTPAAVFAELPLLPEL